MTTTQERILNIFQKRMAALEVFAKRVAELDVVLSVILFGSTARGQDRPDSDIDVALILDVDSRSDLRQYREEIVSMAFDILLEWEVVITCLYFTKREWDHSIEPIIRTIKKEGVIPWQKKRTSWN